MPLPFLGIFGWLATSRAGRIVALVGGVLLAVFLIDRRAYKRGARETKDYIDKASNEAAQTRRDSRDQIDRDVRRPGAADRVRERFSRD